MARKLLAASDDDIVKLYLTGLSTEKIAKQFGVDPGRITRIVKAAGVLRVRGLAKVSADQIVAAYRRGMTVEAVAALLKISKSTVFKILTDRNETRSVADASLIRWQDSSQRDAVSRQMFDRWQRADDVERANMVKAAHDAVRGSTKSDEIIIRSAKTREKIKSVVSVAEFRFAQWITDRGVEFAQQTAVDRYNCDFTIGSVAVEIWGGHWHWYGRHVARNEARFRKLMNLGFDVLVITDTPQRPISDADADYAISFINECRADPSPIRQYRVIWGGGEFSTGGRANDDQITIKPPFTNRRDPTTGRYETASG